MLKMWIWQAWKEFLKAFVFFQMNLNLLKIGNSAFMSLNNFPVHQQTSCRLFFLRTSQKCAVEQR